MSATTEKEVSCKPLPLIINAAQKKNIELSKILDGIPYELSYLLNKHKRIEWRELCKLISNIKSFFTIKEFIELGKEYVEKESYIEGFILFSMLSSSNKLSSKLKNKLLKGGYSIIRPLYSCVNNQISFIEKNKTHLKIDVLPGYSHCPEIFYMSVGVLEKLGSKVAKKGFKLDFTLTETGGIYEISWEDVGYINRIKSWLRWLFNIEKAFVDLTESHNELFNQFQKLEQSEKLLQNQTTQLKTAYEIAKSIRQSLDLNKTLTVITNTLFIEANFASVRIKLFKDADGKDLNIESFSGTDLQNIGRIIKPIIIDKLEIGELSIFPKTGANIPDVEELMNYLMPIINISIHDSLILQTVTDYKNNLEEKVEQRTSELQSYQTKLSEIIELQNRFFTNISHEFRTPLTLILGPANQILEKSNDEELKENAKTIYRSALKLNTLANQLLDISRIEAGKMQLKTFEQNFGPVMEEIVSSFQSFAESKNIALKLDLKAKEIPIYLDRDKFEKIMNNLLSNAIKFTPSGGSVIVEVKHLPDTKLIEINVSDTGIGIPKIHLDRIFDRFYQVDNKLTREYEGTGVGLSLTKELVELHKGKISVESEEGKGSVFTVYLLLGKDHLLSEEIKENIKDNFDENNLDEEFEQIIAESISDRKKFYSEVKYESEASSNLPSLLIVEDNAEVRKYIINILKEYYRMIEASNGEDGLRVSLEQIPDLIISDIMMPKIDGFQLCRKLKADTRTSHIPLILLTAKTTIHDKLEGLETGADDYIMKPFESAELKARIKNLLLQRKRIHEHYKMHGMFEIVEEKITSVDKKFLQNVFDTINNHFSESSFSVEILAEKLFMSRSLLHKKLIALLGEPPVEIIKSVRLNKAAKLIEQNSGNITEIAYDVGFSDSSYFAACFKKQFGQSPSGYHSQHKKN